MTQPKESFEKIAKKCAETVDIKPIHVYYERPHTWNLLPKQLSGLKVLDLGCGSGWYVEQLIKAGALVTAVDASPSMIELTKQRVQEKAQVQLADLEEPLPFSDAAFDIVLAPIVIHYIKDWHPLFRETARVLKKQGLFIFSTHQPQTEVHLFGLKDYFEKVQIIDNWKDIGEVRYYHHTLHEMTEALRDAGFMIDRMLEPKPHPDMEKVDPVMYQNAAKNPWLLFVRAIKE